MAEAEADSIDADGIGEPDLRNRLLLLVVDGASIFFDAELKLVVGGIGVRLFTVVVTVTGFLIIDEEGMADPGVNAADVRGMLDEDCFSVIAIPAPPPTGALSLRVS